MNTLAKIKKTLQFLSLHTRIRSTVITETLGLTYDYVVDIILEPSSNIDKNILTNILDKIFEEERVGFIIYSFLE